MQSALSRRCRAFGSSKSQPRMASKGKRPSVVFQAEPKTGQHTVEDAIRDEALAHFFTGACTTTPTSGGVNNVVQYVDTADGERYILRVYNNGGHSEKVVFEHELLRQLNQLPLSFQVPRALPTLAGGKPHVLLSSGAEACVFRLIPGTLAKTTSPREVGRATGELSSALAKVQLRDAPVPPYYRVFEVHHSINRDQFYGQVESNPAFDTCREAIDYLASEIRALEPKLEVYQQLGLPEQILHGDVHYDNVMVEGDTVSGILDFEFVAYDWRVMELAVALSKYVGEDDPLALISEYVSGYAVHGDLTPQEVAIIPDCINLRIFSNVIYFTGRAIAGEDGIDSLTSRAGSYAKRVRWVNAHRNDIVATIQERMLTPAVVLQ